MCPLTLAVRTREIWPKGSNLLTRSYPRIGSSRGGEEVPGRLFIEKID